METGLIKGNTVLGKRMVHLDNTVFNFLACQVGNGHVTGKALGHPIGFVILDNELVQLDIERQHLQELLTAQSQQGVAGIATL